MITGRFRDGNDHTIYSVNANIDRWATIDLTDTMPIGEPLFIFGNPGPFHDLFRLGYVAGTYQTASMFGDPVSYHMIDLNGWYGDSGAALFNSQCEIIAIVSALKVIRQKDNSDDDSFHLIGTLPLAFRPETWDRIRKDSTPLAGAINIVNKKKD